jgi:hypothetical protein
VKYTIIIPRKYDIQKAEIKLRLITDTYMLQYHHAKFSRNKISPICKLCGEEDEDRMHFLLECKTLEENRKTQMVKLGEALEEARGVGVFKPGFSANRKSHATLLLCVTPKEN